MIPELPLAIGQELTVTIIDLAFGGEGVARIQELVVFVPFVIVGETVKIKIIEIKKHFARAELREVLQPAPERVEPRCPYFGQCGGCQYQHLAYPAQLRLKQKQVRDILQRLGNFSAPPVQATVASPQPYGYRNRIMIRSQWDKFKKGLNIGFVRADSGLVVDVDHCPLAEPAINEQILQVRANPPPKGGLKVVLRVLPPGWEVPRDTFFQNNTFMLPHLIEAVRRRLLDSQARFLIDAYCGVGFFSLELAHQVERFIGVEYDCQAIKAARQNAVARQVQNGEYITGKTEELLPQLLRHFSPQPTAVVLDPPRTGCRPEALQQLRELRPAQIIYVSCHPATLARDLKILAAEGFYHLADVTPVDMFPQTQHVECVADLRSLPSPA